MRNHFVAKLTDDGGPSPLLELGHILHQGPESEARTAWFGTKKPGITWTPAPAGFPSIAMIIAVEPGGAVESVVSRIVGRRDAIPAIPSLVDFYGEHASKMRGWWELADSQRIRFPSLADLPGVSTKGLAAPDSFGGQSSFVYWKLDLFGAFTTAITPVPSWPPSAGLPDLLQVVPYGDVRIRGHRISAFMVFDLFRQGQTPENASQTYPTLSLEKVEKALAYYQSHRAEIDPALDQHHQDRAFHEASSKPGPSLAELMARRARRIAEEVH